MLMQDKVWEGAESCGLKQWVATLKLGAC